jgi:hypothetical protein
MRFAGAPQIANFLSDSPRFDQLANTFTKARSDNRAMNHEAEGFVASSGLDAMSKIKQAGHQARATIAAGEADAAATQAQGMSGMMSGIAGGIGNISFGGGGSGGGGGIPFGSMGGTPVSQSTFDSVASFYGA